MSEIVKRSRIWNSIKDDKCQNDDNEPAKTVKQRKKIDLFKNT